jgi:hypothetical protein
MAEAMSPAAWYLVGFVTGSAMVIGVVELWRALELRRMRKKNT